MSDEKRNLQQLEERVADLEVKLKQQKDPWKPIRTIIYVVIGGFAILMLIGIIQFISS